MLPTLRDRRPMSAMRSADVPLRFGSTGWITRSRKTTVFDFWSNPGDRGRDVFAASRNRACLHRGGSLRFHPRCYYRPDEHMPTEIWPAMIACVTDIAGRITGLHRTWLDPEGLRSR